MYVTKPFLLAALVRATASLCLRPVYGTCQRVTEPADLHFRERTHLRFRLHRLGERYHVPVSL